MDARVDVCTATSAMATNSVIVSICSTTNILLFTAAHAHHSTNARECFVLAHYLLDHDRIAVVLRGACQRSRCIFAIKDAIQPAQPVNAMCASQIHVRDAHSERYTLCWLHLVSESRTSTRDATREADNTTWMRTMFPSFSLISCIATRW